MVRMAILGVAGLVVFLATGCSEPVGEPSYRQSSIRIEGGAPDRVLMAAARVLSEEFPGLSIDQRTNRIESEPAYFVTERQSGTARDLVGARSEMRRQATFTTTQRGGETRAWLRIELQRRDTARQRVVQPATGRLSDAPSTTPIEEETALTPTQAEAWTAVGRDPALERELLLRIEDLVSGRND